MRTLIAIGMIMALSGCIIISESEAETSGPSETVDEATELAAIKTVLDAQEDAWNAGDIDGFMEGYWNSDELRFASGADITYGWQATIDRYKRNYDSREKMGQLTFNDLEFHLMSPTRAVVFGQWHLEREGPDPHGLYTLILHKIEGEWLIVSDHTSSGDAEED